MLVEQYVVICDYVKQDESDVSLKSGNVVDVIEKYEHGKQSRDIRRISVTRKRINLSPR